MPNKVVRKAAWFNPDLFGFVIGNVAIFVLLSFIIPWLWAGILSSGVLSAEVVLTLEFIADWSFWAAVCLPLDQVLAELHAVSHQRPIEGFFRSFGEGVKMGAVSLLWNAPIWTVGFVFALLDLTFGRPLKIWDRLDALTSWFDPPRRAHPAIQELLNALQLLKMRLDQPAYLYLLDHPDQVRTILADWTDRQQCPAAWCLRNKEGGTIGVIGVTGSDLTTLGWDPKGKIEIKTEKAFQEEAAQPNKNGPSTLPLRAGKMAGLLKSDLEEKILVDEKAKGGHQRSRSEPPVRRNSRAMV